MAFLDFIKNRDGQRPAGEQQSQQQKPEVSQEMSAKAAPEKSAVNPTEYVSPDQQARLAEAQSLYRAGTQQTEQTSPAPTQGPPDGATSPQAQRQNMLSQDNAAPDLSPTSAQAGARAEEVEGPFAPASTPAKSQQQTVARSAPSWER